MRYSYAGRLLLGLVLLCTGVALDVATVVLVVAGASSSLLLLHVPAVVVWATGINLALRGDPCWVLTVRSRQVRLRGLCIAGLFFGLCTFPGLGTLAFSAALLASNCIARRAPDVVDESAPLPEKGATLDLDVVPLVDVIYGSDTDMKRAAVAILGREHSANASQLLRQLLSDPQPDIRRDASVALTQLGDELFGELRVTFERWKDDPQDRERALRLAEQYAAFARSNILDEKTQRIYLTKARDLLQQVLTQERTDTGRWIELARLHQGLGELGEALHAIRVALRLEPASGEAFVLAMDLAFCERSWVDFVTFAREALSVLPDLPEARAALENVETQPDLPKAQVALEEQESAELPPDLPEARAALENVETQLEFPAVQEAQMAQQGWRAMQSDLPQALEEQETMELRSAFPQAQQTQAPLQASVEMGPTDLIGACNG